jgi:hypothetical protein
MRAVLLVAAMVFVMGLGCALFTDLGTGGYGPADAGDAQSACDADGACFAFAFSCVGASDCPNGQICCLSLNSTSSATFGCANGPVCTAGIQLCRSNTECTGATCVMQECAFDAAAITIQACGNVCNR